MIRTVTIKNYTNSAKDLVLTLADPESSQGFAVVDMDGLGPVKANYSSNDWVTIDGSNITGIRLPKREINMELRFIPTTYSESIADIREKSYIYFPITKKIGMIFDCVDYFGRSKKYTIDGYVMQNEQTMWSNECGCELTIVCPDPYFKDIESIEESFTRSIPKMTYAFVKKGMDLTFTDEKALFPVSQTIVNDNKEINNPSSIDIGAVFTLIAHGTIKNPVIYNVTTQEAFMLNHTMTNGEIITIDTRKGHRAITLNEGLGKNYIGKMALNSKWITLVPGVNTVGVRADSGINNLELSYKITPLYVGI